MEIMEGNLSLALLAMFGVFWFGWFSFTLYYIGEASHKLHAALDELQAIKGELARIRRATLHQGPYEP
jgi:hypothetical protein